MAQICSPGVCFFRCDALSHDFIVSLSTFLPIICFMRKFYTLLMLMAVSCSIFAQDRLSLFISRANKYASVELSDYRKRLCVENNTRGSLLDD